MKGTKVHIATQKGGAQKYRRVLALWLNEFGLGCLANYRSMTVFDGWEQEGEPGSLY